MRGDFWWIQKVDHRISTGLIFVALLWLLGKGKKKEGFLWRTLCSAGLFCLTSWAIRFWIDERLWGPVEQGLGHALHILAMCLIFLFGYLLCYHTVLVRAAYMDMLALTIYKLSWNTFKAFGYAADVGGVAKLWSRYSILGALVSYGVYALVCLVACTLYRSFVKELPYEETDRQIIWIMGVFLGIQMILEYCGYVFTGSREALFLYYFCALLYTLLNFLVLGVIARLTRYRRDNEQMQDFIRNKMQYYHMSHDGIVSLQVKCHDLKHQIASIRSEAGKVRFDEYLSRLEDSILEYGTVIDCGNETIDIVLTEKNILCSTMGIKFSYMLDGSLFGFLSEMEIYSLFGNALDNALESCHKVADPQKRVISLKSTAVGEMVVLHVENYFEEELDLSQGLPRTTKRGEGHGFGLRSIQEIAGRYGGVVTVKGENHIFKLTVCLYPPAV